jgi:hypothetical protein
MSEIERPYDEMSGPIDDAHHRVRVPHDGSRDVQYVSDDESGTPLCTPPAATMVADTHVPAHLTIARRNPQTGSSTSPTTPVPSARKGNTRNEPTSSGLTPPR